MNIKIRVFAIMLLLTAGCHHDDMCGWDKNEIDNYSFYSYKTANCGISSPIYVVLPGYGGGYNEELGNIVKKHLNANKFDGIILLPYIDYKNGMTDQCVDMVRTILDGYDMSGVRKKIVAGVSAGAVLSLDLSSRWDDVAGVFAVVAGAYKDGGGTPLDNLPYPSINTAVIFLNGYDEDVLKKYKIYFDGTVFVDPTIRLYNDISDGIHIKMRLIADVDHGDWRKLINDDDLVWIRTFTR